MLSKAVQQYLLELLQQKKGSAISSIRLVPIGGGSINEAYRIDSNTGEHFFCKINSATKFPGLFEAERSGLALLKAQKVIRVPDVIACALVNDLQLLILEWIAQGARTKQFWRQFGGQLAALHAVQGSLFGLDANNYMGALVQSNRQHDDWNQFFINERMEPQLKLAGDNHLLTAAEIRRFGRLYIRLHEIFPVASPGLLHGDLWSGNFLCDREGRPVLVDPAVYYGHPAIDLAMTKLFGGFEQEFYEGYSSGKPFPPNYREQWEVCNLYPLLVHLNLFGESYRPAIIDTIGRY